MADAVTSQIIFDGTKRAIMKFTNISDGTGETGAVKVDVSALNSYYGTPCSGVSIERIEAVTIGMGVDILWEATTDALCMTLGADQFFTFDFTRFSGISNNAGAGKNGDVLFTTVGATAGDKYTIVLELLKSY
tara:strand:+ start:51 stop:449 length:399 start_codon:yes stop_codon:yes gene_type:complete